MTHRRLLLSRHTFICEGADILSRTAVTVAPSSPLSSQEKPIQTHDVGCIVLIILCTFYIKKNLDKGEPKSAGNSWMTDKMSSALWTARVFKMTNNRIQLAGLVQLAWKQPGQGSQVAYLLQSSVQHVPQGCGGATCKCPRCWCLCIGDAWQADPLRESVASVSSPLPSVRTWLVRKL